MTNRSARGGRRVRGLGPRRAGLLRTDKQGIPHQERDRVWRWLLPVWLWRDLILALMVGLMVLGVQLVVENQRTMSANRVENLRFVRERSSSDPKEPRPFGGLDLTGQVMNSLELTGANFLGATLRDAQFDRANLSEAFLVDADLSNANLYNAFLRGANLARANFSGANLRDADLRSTRSLAVYGDDHVILIDPDDEVVFVGAILDGATMQDASLIDADFTNATLNGVDMERADLSYSTLASATLHKAILRGVRLKRADLRTADLEGADLTGADLSEADLRGAKLSAGALQSICRYETRPKTDPGVVLPSPETLLPCRD